MEPLSLPVLDYMFVRGLLAGLLMAAPVGAVGAMCIRRALAGHPIRALMVGFGSAAADTVFGAMAGLGIGLIGSFIVAHEVGLTLFGGLVVTAAGIFTFRAPVNTATGEEDTEAAIRDGVRAFVMSIVNPATFLGAIGIFALMGGADVTSAPTAAVSLVIGVFAGSMGWWVILSGSVSLLRDRFVSKALPELNHIEGVVITVFGIGAIVFGLWLLSQGKPL
jgi:arginine exporter protein ArgO